MATAINIFKSVAVCMTYCDSIESLGKPLFSSSFRLKMDGWTASHKNRGGERHPPEEIPSRSAHIDEALNVYVLDERVWPLQLIEFITLDIANMKSLVLLAVFSCSLALFTDWDNYPDLFGVNGRRNEIDDKSVFFNYDRAIFGGFTVQWKGDFITIISVGTPSKF